MKTASLLLKKEYIFESKDVILFLEVSEGNTADKTAAVSWHLTMTN